MLKQQSHCLSPIQCEEECLNLTWDILHTATTTRHKKMEERMRTSTHKICTYIRLCSTFVCTLWETNSPSFVVRNCVCVCACVRTFHGDWSDSFTENELQPIHIWRYTMFTMLYVYWKEKSIKISMTINDGSVNKYTELKFSTCSNDRTLLVNSSYMFNSNVLKK